MRAISYSSCHVAAVNGEQGVFRIKREIELIWKRCWNENRFWSFHLYTKHNLFKSIQSTFLPMYLSCRALPIFNFSSFQRILFLIKKNLLIPVFTYMYFLFTYFFNNHILDEFQMPWCYLNNKYLLIIHISPEIRVNSRRQGVPRVLFFIIEYYSLFLVSRTV